MLLYHPIHGRFTKIESISYIHKIIHSREIKCLTRVIIKYQIYLTSLRRVQLSDMKCLREYDSVYRMTLYCTFKDR